MKQVKFITNKHLKSLIGKQFNVGHYESPLICTCKSFLRFKDRIVITITTDSSTFDFTECEFVKAVIQ